MKMWGHSLCKKSFLRLFIVSSSLLFFTPSCVQYKPKPYETPQSNKWRTKQDILIATACPDDCEIHGIRLTPWWEVMNDPTLTQLIQKGLHNSPTIISSVAKLEQFEALYIEQRANLFPNVSLTGYAYRKRLPKDLGGTTTTNQTIPPTTTTTTTGPTTTTVITPTITPAAPTNATHVSQLQLLPQVNYELDFWGKYRQQAGAALMQSYAQEEDLRTALLLLSIDIANTYYQIRGFDAEIQVLQETADSRSYSLKINTAKYEAGLVNAYSPLQDQMQLASAMQSLEETKRLRDVTEDALAVLIGTSPSEFLLEAKNIDVVLPQIPASISSKVLRQRPDIRQAEFLIESQRLNAGVAKADFFPDFSINAGYGFQSDKSSSLFKWKNHIWNMLAQFTQPIYNAGQIAAGYKAAKAQYKQAVEEYCNKVLNAYSEVEDALISIERRKKQVDYLNEQVNAALDVLKLSEIRYDSGLEDYLTVVDAKRNALSAQRIQVQVTKDEILATISLIKSLGGTWTDGNTRK